MEQLTEHERAILDFERHWGKYAGAKETAVRKKFDCSSTRYYQQLDAIIDKPEAWRTTPCWSGGCVGSEPQGHASDPSGALALKSRPERPIRVDASNT